VNASTSQDLIISSTTDFGVAALAVLGAVIVVAVGLLVFRFGWRKLRGAAR